MDVSVSIKAIRAIKGISQAEVARRLEMDPSAYHRLENRGNKLTIDQVERIANALEVTLFDLFTWNHGEVRPRENKSVEDLQEIIKKITTNRDLIQSYAESLKFKVDYMSHAFDTVINSIGDANELGTVHVEEETEVYGLYYTTYTDKELNKIFEIIYEKHSTLYVLIKRYLREFMDPSNREVKQFLKFLEQKDKEAARKHGDLF